MRSCLGFMLLCLLVWLLESKGARVTAEEDILLPYTHFHGPFHSHHHVRDCLSEAHGQSTYETWPSSNNERLPVAESAIFQLNLSSSQRNSRWVNGHMTVVHDPLRTLSVLEPGGPGGCEKSYRVTVEETAEAAGCLYAQNAGFFNTTTDQCLGNIVSNGRMVRDSRGVQNAQFGIRKDGSLVTGYLSQEDVLDQSNPFVQLVSGVVWLLRNGNIYINQSLKAECNKLVDQEVFRDFVDLWSARTAVGHDSNGHVVLFHVDGQTHERGMNLWEVAEFMKKNGVINAINLDGGGSSSFVINGTLASYPPDICKSDSRWRCARPVSTILCVHQRQCQPANCNNHGDCVDGRCRCHDGWQGAACDSVVCQLSWCGPHGVCTANSCICDAGWRGMNCSQECLPGYYGNGCNHTCICLNGASCNHITGHCTCPPGFYGNFCEHVCPPGFYGVSCAEKCSCDYQCPCDPQTGSCVNSDSRVNRVNQCLAQQTFALWRQQEEEEYRDKPYLTEVHCHAVTLPLGLPIETWLMITVLLAFMLLKRQALHLLQVTRRWFLYAVFYKPVLLTNVKGEKLSESLLQFH